MNDNLGDRMKAYEKSANNFLLKRLPVIIRLDGKAFHTFTKGFNKPFDNIFMETMQETCKYLCKNIMNCKLAYTQSDEISLLLINYETNETESWFNNNIQKMVSVSASMATLEFNRIFRGKVLNSKNEKSLPVETYIKKIDTAMFDSRVFVLPKEEVNNYFIWRQQDASRNSINMVAQSLFTYKELQSKNCEQMQEMMFCKFNINWNNYPTTQKRGSCIVKEKFDKNGAVRTQWVVDTEIPIFTQNKDYINKFVERTAKE